MVWIISANDKIYDYASAFATFDVIEWKQSAKFDIGDTVFIYCSKPVQKVMYKCTVLNCDLPFHERSVNDYDFWKDQKAYENIKEKKFFRLKLLNQVDSEMLNINHLHKNGLKGFVQGPRKIPSVLADYIEKQFPN